jgi:hypothetical protein
MAPEAGDVIATVGGAVSLPAVPLATVMVTGAEVL